MKKISILFIFLLSIITFSKVYEINSPEDFINAISNSQNGDEIRLKTDILLSNYYGKVSNVNLKGITINGENHKLEIINLPLSLSGNSTLKDVKLNLSTAGGINFDTTASNRIDDTQAIYANGYDLTLDNVTTDYENRSKTQPTIYMGSKDGDVNKENKLEFKNSDSSNTKFKEIYAGNESGTKTGKSTIILDGGVRIVGYDNSENSGKNSSLGKNAIRLKNKEGNSNFEVEVKNSSVWVPAYEIGDNQNVTIELKDNNMHNAIKIDSKVKELKVTGNSTLLVEDKHLNVGNLILNAENGHNPNVKIAHINANVTVDKIKSDSVNNKVGFYSSSDETTPTTRHSNAKFTFKSIEGSFKREGGASSNVVAPSNSSNGDGSYGNNTTTTDPVIIKRNELIEKINNQLTNLEQIQKDKLIAEANSSDTVDSLNNIETKSTSLNTNMPDLKQAKSDLESSKNELKQKESSNLKLQETVTLINKYSNINEIDEVSKVESLKNSFTSKKSEIDAEILRIDERDTKRDELLDNLETLENLEENQKENLRNQINSASTKKILEQIGSDFDALNNSMVDLKSKKQNLNSKKENLQRIDNNNPKIREAQDILDKYNNPEEINTSSEVNALKSEMETKIGQIEDEINRINSGIATNNKKEELKNKIRNELTHLVEIQKTYLEGQVDSAEEGALNGIENDVNSLNDAMGQLTPKKMELEAKKEQLNQKDTSNSLLTSVQETLNKYNEYNNIDTVENIANLKQEFESKIESVANEINRIDSFNTKKEEVLRNINENNNNLETSQKNTLVAEVNEANDISILNTIEQKVNNLKAAMGELKSKKSELENLKTELDNLSPNDEKIAEIDTILNEYSTSISNIDNVNAYKDKINLKISEISDKISKIKAKNEKVKSTKEEINTLLELEKKQKDYFINKVENSNTIEEIDNYLLEAKKLNEAMPSLKEAKKELEKTKDALLKLYPRHEKLIEINKLLEKYENIELINEVNKVNNLKEEFNKKVEEIKNILIPKPEKVNLKEYEKYLTLFNYNNIDIVNNFNEKTYFNINLGKSDLNKLSGGVNAGFNLDVYKDLKVGAFIEYEKNMVNQISIGTNLKYKEGIVMLRYRLAEYNKLFNHNIDIYGRYTKEFKVLDNLKVIPSSGIYISYSLPLYIDNKVKLDKKITVLGDIETKINYNVKGIDLYLTPILKFGYSGSKIIDKNYSDNILTGGYDYFVYGLNSGIEKSFDNGLITKFNILLNGNEKNIFRVKSNFGLGYNW